MSQHSPLPLLIELANNERDAVARQLATAQRASADNETQHKSLQSYQDEYLLRLGRTRQSGAAELRNFQAFLAKLELAIKQQAAAVEQHRLRVSTLKGEFTRISIKAKSLEILHHQRLRSAGQREKRREQSLEDEHAARMALRPLVFGTA